MKGRGNFINGCYNDLQNSNYNGVNGLRNTLH